MAELKTKQTDASVSAFIEKIPDARRRKECERVLEMMRRVTGEAPKMWGASMVGFGRYRYKYESGREGEYFVTGFSPRKQALTLYLMSGFDDPLMEELGTYTTGKSCLYLKSLDDVDQGVLEKLIARSVAKTEKRSSA